ncbi:MAG TPA: molybdopterin cofactor-binding domain-containing protein [Candidatus Limnocylindria bacterium]|nr:molybdopterin cofactor-binding domain-containing protein [Candidatus Limnocylindria bacterium]
MSVTFDRAAFLKQAGLLVVAFAIPAPAFAQNASAAVKKEANPLAGPSYPDVDQWLAIDRAGDVTVTFGKVELGTGTQTALLQLVADELYVPFERVHVVEVDTTRVPNQGYTAGSTTLSVGAVPVRQAAATARALLLGLAAERLHAAPGDLEPRDGAIIVANDPSRRATYGELIGAQTFHQKIEAHPHMRPPQSYSVIGKPIPRVELPAKITGRFTYVQNVRVPGMLHARLVLPPRVGAQLESVDESSLHAIPGARVVRKGNFLAVVAQKEWHAVRAARELKTSWSAGTTLPAMAQLHEAVQAIPGTPRELTKTGDVEAVLAASKRAVHARYEWPYQSHGSIGPSCGVADVRDGAATVWSATQGVFPLRGAIAELLNLPAEKVKVVYAEGAGCYGHNGADDVAAAAALISQQIGKPVRLQYMRGDETGWDPKGPAMVHEMRGALDAQGKIAAWDARIWSPTHSGRPDAKAGNTLPGILVGIPIPPPSFIGGDRDGLTNYELPTQRVTIVDQQHAIIRQSAMRGLGGTQNSFANESFVDELAHAAGVDPITFRRRHLTEPRALAVLDAVAPQYKPGRGVAFVHYENTEALVAAVVDLSVDRGTGVVRVNHVWIGHDCGVIVNPDGLRNQIEGNVIQATSRALREAVQLDGSSVASVDWASYPILRFEEIPEVDITLIDRPNEKLVGAGEAATTVMAPAIANAIFAQTGKRLRRAPFTPDAVLGALKA